MTADVVQFPFLPGNPDDPDVEGIKNVMRDHGTIVDDAWARTLKRMIVETRSRNETAGMSRDERLDHMADKFVDALATAPSRDESTTVTRCEPKARSSGPHDQHLRELATELSRRITRRRGPRLRVVSVQIPDPSKRNG